MLLTFCWVKVLLHKCSVLETIYLVYETVTYMLLTLNGLEGKLFDWHSRKIRITVESLS